MTFDGRGQAVGAPSVMLLGRASCEHLDRMWILDHATIPNSRLMEMQATIHWNNAGQATSSWKGRCGTERKHAQ
eukprot:12937661-Prorocentrum_lima.AAC.1